MRVRKQSDKPLAKVFVKSIKLRLGLSLRSILWVMLILFSSFGYGSFLAGTIFSLRLGNEQSDIHNYINNYDKFSQYLKEESRGILGALTNELSFHYIYEKLASASNDPEAALRIITFVSGSIIFFCVVCKCKWTNLWIIALLFHPRVLDLISSQQRMALAVSIFLLVTMSIKRWIPVATAFALGSIHTFMLVVGVVWGIYLLGRIARIDKTVLWWTVGLTAAVLVVSTMDLILFILGDRRAEIRGSPMGHYYAFMWLCSYVYIAFISQAALRREEGALFLFAAASSVFATIYGQYSERYVSISLLLLAKCLAPHSNQLILLILPVYLLNLILSIYFWLRYSL